MSAPEGQPVSSRHLLRALLIAGVVCRLAYVWLTPTFYAPDEQSHFHYVQYLAEQHAFPVLNSKLGDASNEWEYSQPPLYYVLLAPLFSGAKAICEQPSAVVIVLRLVSVLLWLLNFWFAVLLLRRMRITDESFRVLVLGVICLLPTYTFISSTINNDNLFITLGGVLVCLLAQPQPTWKTSLALGVLLGLASLTKQSAVVFAPAIVLLTLIEAVQRRLTWRAAIRHLVLVLGIGGLFFLPWMLRNWRLYHTFTPEYTTTPLLTWPSFPYGVASALHNFTKTFWSVSGMTNDVGYPFPLLGFFALVLWVVGHQQTGTSTVSAVGPAHGPLLNAFLLALAFNLMLVLRFGYQFGMGQGRHLFGLIIPAAIVLALGWRKLPIRNLTIWSTVFWICYALGFAWFSLSRFPRGAAGT